MSKALLILVDAMRPDAMLNCGHPFVKELLSKSTYCLKARTIMPSVTIWAHLSLFYSNDSSVFKLSPRFSYAGESEFYVPSIIDMCDGNHRKTAQFNSWENTNCLSAPGCVSKMVLLNVHKEKDPDIRLTKETIDYINSDSPDFVFLYLGETDVNGHEHGWMGEQYMKAVYNAWDCIENIYKSIPEDYSIVICADHGGHDHTHGTEMEEDMTIPVIFYGKKFEAGRELEKLSIKDIIPTIADAIDLEKAEEWAGVSILA